MSQPLLSICIPTYNQPDAIERLLRCIFLEVNQEIEIIVKDDSSNDDTAAVVQEYSSKFPIKYIRGQKEGLDTAILFLTKEASGKYVWWIGDDAVVSNGVRRVMAFLKKNEPAFVFLNCIDANSGESQFHIGLDKKFKDGSEVLEEVLGGGLGFISATLFKRENAISGIESAKKYIGTAYVNLYLIYHVLSQNGGLYYMSEPVIINYPTNTEEVVRIVKKKDGTIQNQAFQVFGINFFNITKAFRSKFKNRAIRKIVSESFAYTWRGVLVGWVGGWDTPIGKRWQMFKVYWSFPEIWLAMTAFLMPFWLNKVLYKIYGKFYSHRKFIY